MAVPPPFERRLTPEPRENGKLLRVDPQVLMRDNPAALIVNRDMYDRMSEKFTPHLFGEVHIVRVRTFSPDEHRKVVKLFVVDGMTRTKYVADHQDEIAQQHPDFVFEEKVKDVTASYLEIPSIVHTEERENGEQSLTMLQYLRAVVPPTIEHSQIAPDRIAAHLINGWDNMVGEELAGKYSALAALSLLANRGVPTATEKMLSDFLSRQTELVAGETGETVEERVALERALMQISSIIRQSKLQEVYVARSAFELVSAQSPVIGGARQTRKEAFGLLYTPEVEKKLKEAYPAIGERERVRTKLGDVITQAFTKFSGSPNQEQIFSKLHEALQDATLSFAQMTSVLTADEPVEYYDQVKKEVNRERLFSHYVAANQGRELSPFEHALLTTLGRVTNLRGADLSTITQSIKAAEAVAQQAIQVKASLKEGQDEFLARGIRPKTLHDGAETIDKALEAFATAMTGQAVTHRVGSLRAQLSDMQRRMNVEMVAHKAKNMVEETFGQPAQDEREEKLRSNIVAYVIREFGNEDHTVLRADDEIIARRVAQVKELPDDLRFEVIHGYMGIIKALQEQKRRDKPPPPPVTFVVKTGGEITRVEPPVEPPLPVRPTSPPPPVSARGPVAGTEEAPPSREAAEQRKKAYNDALLRQGVRIFLDTLARVDIKVEELSLQTKDDLYRLIQAAGTFAFGHPDIIRAFQDSQELRKENRRLREALLQKEEVDTSKDKRTGR